MITITLNPEEEARLEYLEHKWDELMSFEDYLDVRDQRAAFDSNARGYESSSYF